MVGAYDLNEVAKWMYSYKTKADHDWESFQRRRAESRRQEHEMKLKKSVDLTVLLDESGSMDPRRLDTIKHYNNFLKEQRGVDAPARMSVVAFNTSNRVLAANLPLRDERLELSTDNYRPLGGTALFDAINDSVDAALERQRLDPMNKVVFVIFTDGEENSSRKVRNVEQIKNLLAQRQLAGWEFLYMGASPEAFTQGMGIGVMPMAAAAVASTKWDNAFSYTAQNVASLRSGNVLSASYTANQKLDLETND